MSVPVMPARRRGHPPLLAGARVLVADFINITKKLIDQSQLGMEAWYLFTKAEVRKIGFVAYRHAAS